jgi:hypothetical protein
MISTQGPLFLWMVVEVEHQDKNVQGAQQKHAYLGLCGIDKRHITAIRLMTDVAMRSTQAYGKVDSMCHLTM